MFSDERRKSCLIANIKAQIEQKKMAAEEKTVILEESDVVTEDN